MNENGMQNSARRDAGSLPSAGRGLDDPRPGLDPCSGTVGKLWDYLDEANSAGDREQVQAHLFLCRACRGELGFAEGLRRLLASDEEAEIPSGVKTRLERLVEAL
jgi:hypothetical protein